MTFIKSAFAVILLLLAGLYSCNKRPVTEDSKNENGIAGAANPFVIAQSYQQGDLILGNKLNNPYLVQNITSAYKALNVKGTGSLKPVNIRPTYYYVKFKPANYDQYEVLVADSTLTMSDFPLDYEIIQNGNRYHDPTLPSGTPTYQYAAVKTDYHFIDSIPHEIIASLYIPEVDKTLTGTNNENEDYVDKLLDQAYKQTANYIDTVTVDPQTHQRRPKYNPSGNIQIFDTRLNANIGMEGVEVRARRWFISYSTRPDFRGNYSMDQSFRRPCNFSLWFSTNHFAVREHLFALTAWINGPKQTGPWNYTIADGYDRFVGHIFRGAYRYHYKDIDGLQRPFRLIKRTLYIGKDQSGNSSGVNYIFFPILKIWRYNGDDGGEYMSDEIFSTTCHETGHTSHVIKMNSGIIQYSQVTAELQESWAVAIEWWLTKLEYKITRGVPNYGDFNYHPLSAPQYPNDEGYQYWNKITYGGTYTSIYIDLIDNVNELNQNYPGRGIGTVNDQVSGYTISLIEQNIIKYTYGLSSLATKLKSNKPIGVSDAQIDLLLGFY